MARGQPKNNKQQAKKNGNGAKLGFEATLWAAADALRNNMDAAEYKHVVLGLIFLKYISDGRDHTRCKALRLHRRHPSQLLLYCGGSRHARRLIRSSVSVMTSPSLRGRPPQHGHAAGEGSTRRSRGKLSGSGRRAGLARATWPPSGWTGSAAAISAAVGGAVGAHREALAGRAQPSRTRRAPPRKV
jgi:hypothetical protein